MNLKDITILMPCFNEKRFLFKRCKNIKYITELQSPIIFSDNGSRDGSLPYAKRLLPQKNTTTFRFKKTVRGAKNWQKCLDLAVSKYVAFAAPDDYHCKGFFIKAIHCLDEHPNIDAWMSQIQFIDSRGKIVVRPPKDTVLLPIQNMSWPNRIMYALDGNNNFLAYAVFRRTFLNQFPLSRFLSPVSSEQPLVLAMMAKGSVWVDREVLFVYRLKDRELESHNKKKDRPLLCMQDLFRTADFLFPRKPFRKWACKFWVLIGILRSDGGSKSWYGRMKQTLWRDLAICLRRGQWKEFLILCLFVPLKIKPLRWLVSQHRNYRIIVRKRI